MTATILTHLRFQQHAAKLLRADAEHKTRIAVGRNKPLPNADELRFAAEVSRPCDSGEGE